MKSKRQPAEDSIRPKPLPRRSLISQATDVLRQHISDGVWTGKLPGERHLCETLMISRPTLRSALDQLEKEGIISVSQGKHRVIEKEPGRHETPQAASQVIILSPETASEMHMSTLYLIDEIYKTFQKTSTLLSIQSPPWLKYKKPESYLTQHIKENPTACWALFSVSEAVQKWFSVHAVPAMISGSCFPSVDLPSIDLDQRATAKHAVGTFLRKGFTRILLITPEKLRPGSAAGVEGFLDGIETSTYPGTEGRVIKVTARRRNLLHQIDEELRATPRLGLYLMQPLDALYVLSHLLRQPIRIGKDVGLVCFGQEYFFDHLVVTPSRYVGNKERFAAKICQMLIRLVEARRLPRKALLHMPDFRPGDTL